MQTQIHTATLLPGEKLDYKTCEALEEVFKRLQFKVVDLEQTNLDEDVSTPAPARPRLPGLSGPLRFGWAGGPAGRRDPRQRLAGGQEQGL